MSLRQKIATLLGQADIQLNGDRPWDIQVRNEQLFKRVLTQGTLGLGEAYMDGWWDADRLDQFVYKALRSELGEQVSEHRNMALALLAKFTNMQKHSRAYHVGEQHYNAGNDLFECMLDERLTYTCAYWKDAQDLDAAQMAKLDLVCRKLNLQAGQHILDIGCGWGSFAGYAAERYGVQVTGLTISTEQADYARKRYAHLPIEIRVQDYRLANTRYDHIVSLGMFEHVGWKNYREYFQVAARCLQDDGLFLLHTIAKNYKETVPDPWIHKYIFPNGLLPSLTTLSPALENLFVLEDLHNFGAYYDQTLLAWCANFEAGWPRVRDNYDERFYRMWRYYLLACAGAFRARDLQLWQMVLSKQGVAGVYQRHS